MKFARLLAAKNDDILNAPPVTAAFLGDSVTHGCFECYRDEDGNIQTIFEREQSYAAKFAHIAGMLYPRAQLNIVNAGVSGGTAMQAAARLERDVLQFPPRPSRGQFCAQRLRRRRSRTGRIRCEHEKDFQTRQRGGRGSRVSHAQSYVRLRQRAPELGFFA